MAADLAQIWASNEPHARRARNILVGAAAASAFVGIGVSAAFVVSDATKGQTNASALVPATVGEAVALAFWLAYVGYLLVQRAHRKRELGAA
jgi:cation transporter-like permease